MVPNSSTPVPFINATTMASNASSLNATISTTVPSTISQMVNSTSNLTTTPNPCLNSPSLQTVTSPSKEFWERYVLQITDSINDMGGLRVELVFCLIIAWILVYLCLFKGIKSSGKVSNSNSECTHRCRF